MKRPIQAARRRPAVAKKRRIVKGKGMYDSRYVTADELVSRYRGQVSKRTLANWRSCGEGPQYVKIGGRVMYTIEGIEQWEQSRTRGSARQR